MTTLLYPFARDRVLANILTVSRRLSSNCARIGNDQSFSILDLHENWQCLHLLESLSVYVWPVRRDTER